jgi:hypothetical protein
VSDVIAHLQSVGVVEIESRISIETVARTAAEWEERFRARFVSTLQMIDDDELERGVRMFRGRYTQPDETVAVDLEFEAIVGSVGG